MRIFFSLILAFVLSLNGAYALSVGICDALEREPTPQHLDHLGHHQHHTQVDNHAPDEDNKVHGHEHVHPNFTSIPPSNLHVLPFSIATLLHPAALTAFVSTTLFPPERPPRAVLV